MRPFLLSRIKKGDVVLICLTIAIAGILAATGAFFSRAAPKTPGAADCAVVRIDGEVWRRIPLNTDTTIIYGDKDRRNVISVEDGRVRMAEANCRDGLCVGKGYIRDYQTVIVCLPNRITVRLENSPENNKTVDVIVNN